MNLVLGREAVECLREMLDQELGRFITDYSFSPHLSIYRQCKLERESKAQLKTSVVGVRLVSLVAKYLTLRENQRGQVTRSPLAELEFSSS